MADGIATLPPGIPKLTLGYEVMRHATRWIVQPNGPRAGKPWEPTLSQARFLLWWYALDESGRWLFDGSVRRLAKGSGKSPFAGVCAVEELIGPVRLKDFDPGRLGGCVGMRQPMAWVQIAATAESQTANTMRMVNAYLSKGSPIVRQHGVRPGLTVHYTAAGGKLEVITSSAAAQEGAEITFAVKDETEHWVPSMGGPKLSQVLDRNLRKSGSRWMETCNAWEPGAEDVKSVAETTFEEWEAQQEGRSRAPQKILYDARIAPPDVDLTDEGSLRDAIAFVYDDCHWVNHDDILGGIWDTRTPINTSRRFYLNQPVADHDSWVEPTQWLALKDKTRAVAPGEAVVLFFDGSKSRDGTGLVGCAMSDGHVFVVYGWEPDWRKDGDEVDAIAVDAAVARAFDTWDVVGFFADVKEWDGFSKVTWPERYADRLLIDASPHKKPPQSIAWDMRTKASEFEPECDLVRDEIERGAFGQDGNPMLARHVANAKNRPGRYGTGIGKESKDSRKKIDLAVCMIGARMVRRRVLASPEWEKRNRKPVGRGRVVVLG